MNTHPSFVQHLRETGRGRRRGNPISPSSSGLCREACGRPAVAELAALFLSSSPPQLPDLSQGQPPGKCLILKQERAVSLSEI